MSKNPEAKRLEFPIQGHDKCPMCGCKERIGQMKIAELVEDGILTAGMFPKGPMEVTPLIDQSKPIMVSQFSIEKPKIPILQFFFDYCANPECLHRYCTGSDFIMQEITIPKAPFGLPGKGQNPFAGPPLAFGRG